MVLKELKYCNKCKKKNEYIKCGFGEVGSLSGNGRYECKICRSIVK